MKHGEIKMISLRDFLNSLLPVKLETDIDINFPGAVTKHLKTSDVKSMEGIKKSMMTEGLYAGLSSYQDMANLLEYLKGLVKK